MTLKEKLQKEDFTRIDRIKLFYDGKIMTKQVPVEDVPENLLNRQVIGYEFKYLNKECHFTLADSGYMY